MNRTPKKPPPPSPSDLDSTAERRAGSFELLIIDPDPQDNCNPYDRQASPRRTPRPPRRDLRRLSEWIKQMRELEARRQRGDDD